MMQLKNYITFLILFFSLSNGYGQDTGIVKFLVDVDNGYFEIVMNDTIYLKRYKDTLPVGNYSAKIWSPGYVLTETNFTIEKDKVTEQYVEMAKSNERLSFEKDYGEYRMNFHKRLTIPATATLVTSLTTAYFMMRAFDLKKSIVADMDLYSATSSTSEITDLKLRIDNSNKRYNRNRFGYYISGGLSALLLGGTIYSYVNFKRNYTEPVLNSESPFKDRFSFSPTFYGGRLTFTFG